MTPGQKFDRVVLVLLVAAFAGVAIWGMWTSNAEITHFGETEFGACFAALLILLNQELLGKNGSAENPTQGK
jgi:hypothetical protein